MEQDRFQPLDGRLIKKEEAKRDEFISYWKDVWLRFGQNRGAMIGIVILFIIALFSIFGPFISPYDYQTQDPNNANQEAFGKHYFGTDSLGRDLWSRIWYGAKISLLIALFAVSLDVLIGVTYGFISGYFGGWVDDFMQRLIEIIYAIPNMVIIILMLLWLEPGIIAIAVALAITGWIPMARIVRAQVLKLKEQEFVLVARTLGANHFWIMIKHLLPNVMGTIVVAVTFSIPQAIYFEAFLSFIGLGLRPPEASLGVLVNEGFKLLQLFPYQLFWPALVISLIMLAFNLLGDGLRDSLDPKMKR